MKTNGRSPEGFLRALKETVDEALAQAEKDDAELATGRWPEAPASFDPVSLVRRIVVIDSYTDDKGRTLKCLPPRHGIVTAVEPATAPDGKSVEHLIHIRISMGAAIQDRDEVKRFGDPTWRLAFPRKGER